MEYIQDLHLAEDDALYLYYTGNVKHPGDYDYIYEGRGHNVGLAITKDGILPDSNQCILENKDYPDDLSCHVRDPKVWKMDGKYYMVLGARTRQDKGELLIFESTDKYNWKHINVIKTENDMGYMWECPDIFCVDGQWIVMTSPQGMQPHDDIGQNVYSCGYFPLKGILEENMNWENIMKRIWDLIIMHRRLSKHRTDGAL